MGDKSKILRGIKGDITDNDSDGLYVGGVTDGIASATGDANLNNKFGGRLSNLVVNWRFINFGDNDLIDEIGMTVALESCEDTKQTAVPTRASVQSTLAPTLTTRIMHMLPPPSCAASPVIDVNAYHFNGDPRSKLEFLLKSNQLMKRKLVSGVIYVFVIL